MEIDTGAAISLMSQKTQRQLFPVQTLEEPSVKLTTSELISVVGTMKVQVKYRDYVGEHTLYVVQGRDPTLLGREWLQHIQLDWWSLRVGTLPDVLGRSS